MTNLAIQGGDPVRSAPFQAWPPRDSETERQLVETYRSGRWGAGDAVARFERTFADFIGAKYAAAVSSGTAGLEIALRALGVDSGAQVIVPGYTFFSTVSAVLRTNAIPVFVDVDPLTYCMDAADVERKMTEKTQAIIPVHMFGYPMELDELMETAARRHIRVLEDCAHAHGAERNGRRAGAFGDMAIFSFMSSKLMSAGEGGIIVTSSNELCSRARSFLDCGRLPGHNPYQHYFLGTNNRLTEFQAVILQRQLDQFADAAEKRRQFVGSLADRLQQIDGLTIGQPLQGDIRHAYLGLALEYDRDAFQGLPRESFCLALRKEGIPCEIPYDVPVYRNPLFEKRNLDRNQCPINCSFYGEKFDLRGVDCPVAEKLCRQLILLPHFMLTGDGEDIDDIAAAILKIQEFALDLLFETDLDVLKHET